MKKLEDKVAIVTGASSGIGHAAAILFAQHGARVVVAARRKAPLHALAEAIAERGGRAIACAGDVADEDFARRLVEVAHSELGGLDVAFNNAGTLGAMGPTTGVDRSAWDDTMATNLTSAFLAAKFQLPAMQRRGGGSIVYTSTFVGHTVGFAGMAAYAASKAGLIGFTKALAVEAAEHGVRVNALLPGGTDTPMGRTVARSPEERDHVRSLHALKRLATPEEIARAALFLASEDASFTTGSALLADGGLSICRA